MWWINRYSLVRNGTKSGALGGIRTPDTWFRRPVLYPLSYERLLSMLSRHKGECKVCKQDRRLRPDVTPLQFEGSSV
jgi:hypothetical protein